MWHRSSNPQPHPAILPPPSTLWDARHGPVWWMPTGSFGDQLRHCGRLWTSPYSLVWRYSMAGNAEEEVHVPVSSEKNGALGLCCTISDNSSLFFSAAYTTYGVAGRKRSLSAARWNAWAGRMLYKDSVSLTPLVHIFRGRPLALRPLKLALYACWAGWCIGSCVRCSNHLILWCCIWWWVLFVPSISLILVLGIRSLLVLLTAFLLSILYRRL